MEQPKENKGSLKGFFEWNYLKLKNYARNRLGGPKYEADAEDILQDVAINLFSQFDIDSTVRDIAAYTYRAIRNRIIDYRRKKNPEIPIAHFTDEDGNDRFMLIPDDAPIEAILDGIEEEEPEDLNEALSLLPAEDRELIIENELNGRTFAELSEEWGISQGTLLSRKYRALHKLHKTLAERNTINNVKKK
jgi:RNA polymerase sigma factor (sigma-70 family)